MVLAYCIIVGVLGIAAIGMAGYVTKCKDMASDREWKLAEARRQLDRIAQKADAAARVASVKREAKARRKYVASLQKYKPKTQCPACGHEGKKIEARIYLSVAAIQSTCNSCNAVWDRRPRTNKDFGVKWNA